MVKWSDIRGEYEGLETGFRRRVVELFWKYEGKETDEKTKQGRPVVVSQQSFATKLGIPRRTFDGWVAMAKTAMAVPDSPADLPPGPGRSCLNDGVPPGEGIFRPLIIQLEATVPLVENLARVGGDGMRMVAEDIAAMRKVLDQLELVLKGSERNAH